jgi:hypothetical protein
VQVRQEDWQLCIDGEVIEHVDEFLYLGFKLDTRLTDEGHVKLIRDRCLKAARAVGQVMRDMKCSSLVSLKRYFTTLVASQLYGLIFVDAAALEFERAVGIFFKTALGLADLFPSAAALSILSITPIQVYQQEQRMKFLLKVEGKPNAVAFSALMHDRCVLFPLHVGLNALLGDVLLNLGAPRTLDFKEHFSHIISAVRGRVIKDLRTNLLVASGRAF